VGITEEVIQPNQQHPALSARRTEEWGVGPRYFINIYGLSLQK